MFYNTGIATYIWVLTNRKPEHRRGKVQLIDATNWFRPLRKNLGQKNCELGEAEIERICRTFLDFEESEESRIFENRFFGHWRVTVDRPLRLAVDLSEARLEPFWVACRAAGDPALAEAAGAVAERIGAGPHRHLAAVEDEVRGELKRLGGRRTRLTIKRRGLLHAHLADRDEAAEPVIDKVLPRGTAADPIRGRFAVGEGRGTRVVEYERDSELRDTEQISLLEEGGIEAFLRQEVLPWAADAWYDEGSVKIGYEISFNRVFYKPKPMRTLEEITADILATEREAEGLLSQITGGFLARESRVRYRKLRVYADTSVIGGCEDEEFRTASRRLMDRVAGGEITLVVSSVMLEELDGAPKAVQDAFFSLPPEATERVQLTAEARALADHYIASGALTEKMRADALHIAIASTTGVDALVSWNFRDIVNERRMRQYDRVNRNLGYRSVGICTPEDFDDDE